jgi:hypothetical protein
MRFWLPILVLILPLSALAQEFEMLADDVVLNRAEVVAVTEGPPLTYYDGGVSRYSAGGAYSYTYAGGGSAFGQYEIDPEGILCITYRNGRSRCDRFVRSHGRLVLLTESGERFPVRP